MLLLPLRLVVQQKAAAKEKLQRKVTKKNQTQPSQIPDPDVKENVVGSAAHIYLS